MAGASWEGFVIESPMAVAPPGCQGWFYRTAAGAELDLVLEWPDQRRWAIAVKRSLRPRLGKGFHQARVDLQPARIYVVTGADVGYHEAEGVEVMGLAELAGWLRRGVRGLSPTLPWPLFRVYLLRRPLPRPGSARR